MKKDLLTVGDLTKEDIENILKRSSLLKEKQKRGETHCSLIGKTLGMFFEKASTRTRVSFEVGIYQLGGQAIFLTHQDLQIGRGETIADTARVLSRYIDCLVVRTFSQKVVEELARYATIPVINGLTDTHHPCQVLSDLFTIFEKKGRLNGLKLCYIGDGNNVANSLIEGATRVGINLTLACPDGYEPLKEIVRKAIAEKGKGGPYIEILRDPLKAAEGADMLYTDVWASMGQESERGKRLKVFSPYQVNSKIVQVAKPDVLVMHCLPAHRGEEITDEVIDGKYSIVLDQSENRLHTQKAILEMLMAN
ncbi:MAG: ornithine carbamoyltransferase [Nitrospirae bacterium]|nr:ornithine carbamoyltransferase [Nitrospirota bacterium]